MKPLLRRNNCWNKQQEKAPNSVTQTPSTGRGPVAKALAAQSKIFSADSPHEGHTANQDLRMTNFSGREILSQRTSPKTINVREEILKERQDTRDAFCKES